MKGRCRGVSQGVVLRDLVSNIRPSFFSFANVLKVPLTAKQRLRIISHRDVAQDSICNLFQIGKFISNDMDQILTPFGLLPA